VSEWLSPRRLLSIGAVVGVSGLLAAQVPADSKNPNPKGKIPAPPAIETVLRRACYDCHSNETRWPWYAHIAPFSWWIANDVTAGRREINFSDWSSYRPTTQLRKLRWLDRSLHEESMPPWSYLIAHPGARLSEDERALLRRWTEAEISKLSKSTPPTNDSSR
jgi:hypothetical protein